jgi:hypothetical protein
MAILYANFIWEGLSTEIKPTYAEGARDGHLFKELDKGLTYIRRLDVWESMNVGLSFIMATKSGKITTNSSGYFDVVFNTPFIDDNYIVTLTCGYSTSKTAIPTFDIIFNTGFRIWTKRTNGNTEPNVVVSWLATRNYNP